MDIPNLAFDAMRTMALDPSKRVILVQDETCMGGLVLILSNPDHDIVNKALDILVMLAEFPENRHPMKNVLGLTNQIETLLTHPDGKVQDQARKIQHLLHNVPLFRDTANQHRQAADMTAQQKQTGPKKEQSQRRRRNSFFVSGGIAKNRIIVLQIRGLIDRDDVDTCRNCLLTVKGVISITIDFSRKRATLRTRPEVQPETLAKAIARTMTMAAEQVLKDEDGKEKLLSFGSGAAQMNKENEDMPDYPEEDSPIIGDKNIARIGGQQREEGWNFVKSVGNFLSNSFYW